jgi:hypothetical protein
MEAAESLGMFLPGVQLVLEQLEQVEAKSPHGGELGTQSLITAL